MRTQKWAGPAFGLVLGAVLIVTGCSVDGDSSVSSEVDARIAEAQQQQQAESEAIAAAAAQQQQASTSSSSSTPTPTNSGATSSSSSSGSLGGFVWKPISEGDGNLVVLASLGLREQGLLGRGCTGGSTVESGRFTGNTNGNRPTYRFRQPGSGYGTNLLVVARLRDGTTRTWSIPSGGRRVG